MVTDVLMSIRPIYAEAIFDGIKTVELRRRRPSFVDGTRVLVYSSSPHQKLLGTFRLVAYWPMNLVSFGRRSASGHAFT